MLRSILVPLGTSSQTSAAMKLAASMALAKRHGEARQVSVTGLSIVDSDQIPSGRYANVVNREELLEEAAAKADDLMGIFINKMVGYGIADEQVHTLRVTGSPFEEIVHASVFNDVIVVGEKCSFPPVNQDYHTMQNLYHKASRPVLLTAEEAHDCKKVVLAMDGSASSSRMIYAFLHLNLFPNAEVLMVYSEKERQRYHLDGFYKHLEDHVREFFRRLQVKSIPGAMDEEIAALVQSEGADLLAIGIHQSHFLSRLRDAMYLREPFADQLLKNMNASLFTVH